MTQYSDEMDCFDKLRLLKNSKCNQENCPRSCHFITKGTSTDKFWCNFHYNKEVKEGRIKPLRYNFSLYPIARLLVFLGIVKL